MQIDGDVEVGQGGGGQTAVPLLLVGRVRLVALQAGTGGGVAQFSGVGLSLYVGGE